MTERVPAPGRIMTTLRRIGLDDLSVYRDVRLRALLDAPTAFGSTYAKESRFSDVEWSERVGRLDGERAIGYLAVDGDVACGLVGCFLDGSEPPRATLISMWVAPSHRRKGVGRALVEAVLEWAAGRGAGTVRLMVTSENHAARRFYESLGFNLSGVTDSYPNDPSLTELEMVRVLAS